MKAWRRFLAGLGFLTRVPVPEGVQLDGASLAQSPPLFPAVGALIGITLAGFDLLACRFFPASVVAVVDLVAIFLVTGGLHLDGLLDTADGLLSGRPRDGVLEIMKDSRVGAMGVSAGILVTGLKIAAIASLSGSTRWQALLLAPIAGRYVMAAAIAAFPYARTTGGLGSLFKDRAGEQPTAGATVIDGLLVVSLAWAVAGVRGVVASVVSVLIALGLAGRVTRQIGGLTGDVYGALCEISETAVYLAFVARW